MMAKKDRFPSGYSASVAPHYESEGSGSLDHIEDSSAPTRKWIDLNSASNYGFAVPVHTIPLSQLSSSEAKNLVLRLASELEQVRFLLNKVELQKKKPVNAVTLSSSNDIHSWSNAQQRGLQVGNTKKSSGLGYGPGKKGRGWNRSSTGKFLAGEQNMLVNANAGLLKQCESLLKKLMSQQYGWVFNTPVDVVKLNIPDYFDVIKNPMDLGTIKRKLISGKYLSPLEFLADVRLTFANAKTYNPPGSDVHIMADTMSQFFELRWKAVEKKLVVDTSQSLPKRSEIPEETEIAKPMHPSKKRKLSPALHEKIQEPVKRMMGDEEKHKLSYELENFVGEMPDSIVDILREQSSSKGDGEEDEIELDINALSDDILFTLRKLLDDHFQEKQKDLTKSEACEIELPNVSGLSNSSLRVDKGNDPLDEDVDIGGNEAPVTSYPPVVIGKDAVGRAEEYIEAGPDSDGGSEGSKGSAVKQVQDDVDQIADSDRKAEDDELVDGHLIGQGERQLSPDKQYRAAILKKRFLDTILKAREKTLQDDKMDPEKLRREREELEMHKRREKARLQAEAKAAENARKQAEAEAAAEAKRRREIEREAAREALLKMEKTVEINENSKFLEDLEKLRVAATEPLPSSVDETSPDHSHDGFENFNFGGSNPLEQLGLYMKDDDEDEEGEPPSAVPNVTTDDAEEGEID